MVQWSWNHGLYEDQVVKEKTGKVDWDQIEKTLCVIMYHWISPNKAVSEPQAEPSLWLPIIVSVTKYEVWPLLSNHSLNGFIWAEVILHQFCHKKVQVMLTYLNSLEWYLIYSHYITYHKLLSISPTWTWYQCKRKTSKSFTGAWDFTNIRQLLG